MRKKIIMIVLAVAVVVGLYFGYRANPHYFKRFPRVWASMTTRTDLIDDVRVAGRVLAADARDFYAKTAGTVSRVLVAEGDEVAAGQTLLVLAADDKEMALAQCRVDMLRLQQELDRLTEEEAAAAGKQGAVRSTEQIALAEAEQRLRLMEELFAAGAATQSELDRSRTDYETAERKWRTWQREAPRNREIAQADLEILRLRREMLQREMANLKVTAPIAGRVAQMLPKSGEMVGAGARLGQIIDASQPVIEAVIPPEDAARVKEGDRAEVAFGTLAEPYSAEVVVVLPAVKGDQGYSNPRALLRAASPEAVLQPGLNVQVRIIFERSELTVVVPIEAIHEEAEVFTGDPASLPVGPAAGERRRYVFTLVDCAETLHPANRDEENEQEWMIEDNIYEARKVYVEIGASQTGWAEVLSGLGPFQRVIVYSDRPVRDYDRVIVVNRDERYKTPIATGGGADR